MTHSTTRETEPSLQHSSTTHQLPRRLTSFVGRKKAREELRLLLAREEVRLLTLTGAGGVGKTRLALKVADDVSDVYPDGIAFVSLESVNDPHRVPGRIARSLGIREDRGQALNLLCEHFAFKNVLLIIDNVEQVIEAAPVLSSLLQACEGLTILATSRIPLRIEGEQVYQVDPLSTPASNNEVDLAILESSEAVRLFLARALAANPRLSMDSASITALAEICRRLDGFPLAIELAAARTRQLPLPEMLRRLDDRFQLLTAGARDQPARMQSMFDAISWSYDLLEEDEQRLFRWISACPGGFTLAAIDAFFDRLQSSRSPLDLLLSLLDSSLVQTDPSSENQSRFRLYESVRQFGLQKLIEHGEEESVRIAHAFHIASIAREIEKEVTGPGFEPLFDRLDQEGANVLQALETLRAAGNETKFAVLVGDLAWYWFFRGRIREAQSWLEIERALNAVEIDPNAEAWLLISHGLVAQALGNLDAAERCYRESAELAIEIPNHRNRTIAWEMHAAILILQGDDENANLHLEELETDIRALLDISWVGHNLFHRGLIAFSNQLYEESRQLFAEGAEAYDAGFATTAATDPLLYRVLASLELKDFESARCDLASVYDRLEIRHGESYFSHFFAGLCALLVAERKLTRAAEFATYAITLRRRLGAPFPEPAHAEYQRAFSRCFPPTSAKGSSIEIDVKNLKTLEEMLAIAATVLDREIRSETKSKADIRAFDLTEREVEVLRNLAEGKTNAAIGDSLFISSGTVRTHVANILSKLDAHTRTEAVAIARRHEVI